LYVDLVGVASALSKKLKLFVVMEGSDSKIHCLIHEHSKV
jgi:hypothetical protein